MIESLVILMIAFIIISISAIVYKVLDKCGVMDKIANKMIKYNIL